MVVLPNGFDIAQFKPDASARASLRAELGLAADTVLIGAVGLFALVALVMLVTRKVNWYGISGEGELGTEGQEGQPGQFEMLPAERNADDGDGEKAAQKDMSDGQFPSEQDDPDDIADRPGGAEVADHHLPSEGPEDE